MLQESHLWNTCIRLLFQGAHLQLIYYVHMDMCLCVCVCAVDSFWYIPVFIASSSVMALMSRPKVLDSEAAALVNV